LDTVGAEQLLGKGDMLYLASDAAKPVRVQGTYVSDREIEEITRFWREAGARKPTNDPTKPQRKPLPLKPTDGKATENGKESDPETVGVSPLPAAHTGQLNAEEQDELLPKAIQLVKQHDRASASLLQRRLRIGYSKAAQLLDLLEQQGIVGPPEDGRSREVVKDGTPTNEL
jgi:S-DNA-T family DNA segregation ATPase FtsK/SpoIIIE